MAMPPDTELNELKTLGDAIYARFRADLEKKHSGKFVAIHVDSGDFAIGDTSGNAGRALLKRHPIDGRVHIRRISDDPDFGLAARLGSHGSAAITNP